MPDLCRIFDYFPLRWRYVTATAVPLIAGLGLYFVFGWWSMLVGTMVAVICVWFLGHRQMTFFLRSAIGIIRTRSIDRRYRLTPQGPPEQRRIVNAVNRLADNVEQTLFESDRNRRYYETILNEVTVGILVVDEENMMQYANPAARSILGFEMPRYGSQPVQLASRVNIYEINEAVAASAIGGETVRRNIELYDSNRHLEVFTRSLPPDDNGTRRAIVIVNDRTDEFRLGVSMREFVANASHELRTPIASIQASVETLKMGAASDPDTTRQFLDRIDDSSQRMATLVSEMMDLTLLETGRSPLQLEMTDLTDLINSVLRSYGPVDARSGHEITTEIEDDVPAVLVDRPKMERAIGNLLVNARKFTPSGGTVKVGCRRDDCSVIISVEDNGEGIDQEEMPLIFERFYKSPRSTGDRSGFGLGLAITQNIVEIHNGSVDAHSVMGEGSTFTVRLPIPSPDLR